MTTKFLQRRLDKLRQAGSRPIVVDVPVGVPVEQARRRAAAQHVDLSERDVVFIVREGAKDNQK
jgi:hypothetical protein